MSGLVHFWAVIMATICVQLVRALFYYLCMYLLGMPVLLHLGAVFHSWGMGPGYLVVSIF